MKIGNCNLGTLPLLLAPMEDITDPPFRRICKQLGADLLYTEFISSEGLIRDAIKSAEKLDFEESERPIAIQIFGHEVSSMIKAAQMAAAANPDIIDINFGCPVKKVVSKGAGSAMLRTIPKMLEITRAVVNSVNIPVTVKTRLGWDEDSKNIVDVAELLQDTGIAALTIHGRTRSQLYKGEADWELIGKVKNNPRMHIPIIGNGDITSPEIAAEKAAKYGVDGLMIGRAAIGNPWIFKEIKHYLQYGTHIASPSITERVKICRIHLQNSVLWKGEKRTINEMRKHYASYFKGLSHFKEYRIKLVTFNQIEDIYSLLDTLPEEYNEV